MNRHLSILTVIALSLNAGLAYAQDADRPGQDPQQQQDADQARRDAEQARKEAEQAKKQAEQARRQALKQAEQARRDAQRQAQDEARAQAQAQAEQARAQAEQARAQADEARARAKAQAQQAREADGRGRLQGVTSGDGKIYAPGPFDSIVLDGAGQVRLVQGDRDEVFVAGDANAQEAVDIRLNGSRIKIDLPGSWKFWNNGGGAQVEVRVRNLNKLTLSGANDVVAPGPITGAHLSISMAGSGVAHFDQLKVNDLSFDISGAGEGQLAGKVDHLQLSVSGKGKLGAEGLKANGADVSISGVGNASLWAVNALRVQISGAGHVEYWGQPDVRKSISGFGSVDPRGDKQ